MKKAMTENYYHFHLRMRQSQTDNPLLFIAHLAAFHSIYGNYFSTFLIWHFILVDVLSCAIESSGGNSREKDITEN